MLKVLTPSSMHTLPIYSLKDGHCSATQVDNGSIPSGPDLGRLNPEPPCSQKSNPPDDILSVASEQPGWWGEVEPLVKDGYGTVPWSNRLGFEAHRRHTEPSSPQGPTGTLAVAATRSLRSKRGLFSTWQSRSVLSHSPSRPFEACSSQPHLDNCIINCVQVIHPEEVVREWRHRLSLHWKGATHPLCRPHLEHACQCVGGPWHTRETSGGQPCWNLVALSPSAYTVD